MEGEDSISDMLMKKLYIEHTQDESPSGLDPLEYPLIGEDENGQSKFIQNKLITVQEEIKEPFKPSKVLLMRNLPVDVTEKDIY